MYFKSIEMTIVAIIAAVVVIFLIYKFVVKNDSEKSTEQNVVSVSKSEEAVSGEVKAAIALALYMHKSQLHDHENAVLTINQVSRTYSPWSSKIYGLTQHPRFR